MTDTTNDTLHSKHLRILQYNVSRSREIIDSILNDRETENHTILLLQELYWSPHQCSSPLHQSWTLIEPPTTNRTPRTAIYVNNAVLPSSMFKQLPIPHRDITAISISTNNAKPTLLINIYNQQTESIICPLRQYLQSCAKLEDYEAVIILGDFNLHHPLWNPCSYTKHNPLADDLVELMMDINMMPLLPLGTITFPTNNDAGGTSIDLIWGNARV